MCPSVPKVRDIIVSKNNYTYYSLKRVGTLVGTLVCFGTHEVSHKSIINGFQIFTYQLL